MARHIHVHFADAACVRPLAYKKPSKVGDGEEITAADYEQLAEELLAFIAEQEKKGKTGDAGEWKEEDHPRAANGQFGQGGGGAAPKAQGGGLGPKPTSTTAKVAKHAVHELLSSGHPWSVDELQKITGHANQTTLVSWLSMFKNAKTAGSKGTLNIVKLPNGQYQVVKQDGQPAPKVEVPKASQMPPDVLNKPAAPAKPPEPPKPAPKPEPVKPAPAPPPVAPVVTFGASTVTLPKVATGISARDFDAQADHGSKFGANLWGLQKGLQGGIDVRTHAAKVQIKKEVEASLKKELEGSKAFQQVRAIAGKTSLDSLERRLIGTWASSSGDHNPVSCSMQLAIRDAFNLKDTELGGMDMLKGGASAETEVWRQAASTFGYKMDTPERVAIFKEAMGDFAKAQYNNTQKYFKDHGITEISVVRGMRTKPPASPEVVSMGLQPASSFSALLSTSNSFAGPAGTMLAAKIPVSHVLSTYRTGYGCANEHEVVVLGDRSLTAVASKKSVMQDPTGLASTGQKAFSNARTKEPATA
jgi:hypothetical protein